jgi:hypothetical protein
VRFVAARRRVLVLALVAVALGGFGVAPARAADPAYIAAAVTWSAPDEQVKTITATIRLTLTPACTPSQMAARSTIPQLQSWCTVTQAIADAIKANIEKAWTGQTYRCYRIIVKVDVTINDDPDPKDLNRLVVRVDQQAANVRSQVSSLGPVGSAWNGAAYGDRTFPTNTPGELSRWGYPPQGANDANLYAHEAGHVMGLEDGYEDVPDPNDPKKTISQKRADAPDDLMTHQKNSKVDASTMNTLIGRSGVFRNSPPKCDYKIDTNVDWYHFTSLKCGTAEGTWNINVDGTRDLGGAALVLAGAGTSTLTKVADQQFTGTWEADFRINLVGVPLSIGGQEGNITGDASFDGKTLNLVGTHATGDFWAQTPALALGGAVNPLKSFALPVTNDAYCPYP